jgi:hypothetical protein
MPIAFVIVAIGAAFDQNWFTFGTCMLVAMSLVVAKQDRR